MATQAEVQALIDGSTCDQCYLPGALAWYGVLAALIDIGNGLDVPTAQELASESACLQCISPGLLPYALIAAMRASGIGGGGGSGSVLSGAGAPVADPGVTAAIYFDTNDGTQYNFWSGVWH